MSPLADEGGKSQIRSAWGSGGSRPAAAERPPEEPGEGERGARALRARPPRLLARGVSAQTGPG